MKKIKIVILTLCIAAGMSSCNYTNLEPTDMVSEKVAFKDVEGVYKVTIGIYAKMSLSRTLGIAEYIADDVQQGGQAGGRGTNLTKWNYTTDDGDASSFWSNSYNLLDQANRVINYGPDVTPANETDKATLWNCIGEAYFFRAYTHFELLRFYSDFNTESKLGVPYVTKPHVDGRPARATVESCYDWILYDLSKAAEYITTDTPSNKYFLSLAAVSALRARVYLYRKDYTMAKIYAQDALRKVPMAEKDAVSDVWLDKKDDGVILTLARASNQDKIGGNFVGADNSSVFLPTNSYMAIYSSSDVRSTVFYDQGPDREGTTVWRVKKWIGGTQNIGLCTEKLFRAEEMKLIEAEAMANLTGELDGANDALNLLRSKRIDGWTSQTYDKEGLIAQILLERRRELAFEGHRFFDLRRHKKDIVRDGTLEANNFRMLLPIPTSEMDANPNIPQSDQNPGY